MEAKTYGLRNRHSALTPRSPSGPRRPHLIDPLRNCAPNEGD